MELLARVHSVRRLVRIEIVFTRDDLAWEFMKAFSDSFLEDEEDEGDALPTMKPVDRYFQGSDYELHVVLTISADEEEKFWEFLKDFSVTHAMEVALPINLRVA